MSKIIINHKFSDGDKVLLTEKVNSNNQVFQFWCDDITEPEKGEYGNQRAGASIEIKIGTDEDEAFISLPTELLKVRSGIHVYAANTFVLEPERETGVIWLNIPKGMYVRFELETKATTSGIITAVKLLNED